MNGKTVVFNAWESFCRHMLHHLNNIMIITSITYTYISGLFSCIGFDNECAMICATFGLSGDNIMRLCAVRLLIHIMHSMETNIGRRLL